MTGRKTHGIGAKSPQFERKLAAYALAGAALAVPGVAKAGIIDVVVNQSVTQPGSYEFNLSGPSSGDIVINAGSTDVYPSGDPANEVFTNLINSAGILGTGSIYTGPAALAFGALIDPADPNFNSGGGGKMVAYDTTTQSLSTNGAWPGDGGTAYLGFYFTDGNGIHPGWADIATTATNSGASFEVLEYAYQSAGNSTITAGEESPTPEPSSMSLIALGGAGLIALRRRRSRNA
jgi:hypothetical protein